MNQTPGISQENPLEPSAPTSVGAIFTRIQPVVVEIAKSKDLDELAKKALEAIHLVIPVEFTGFYFLHPVTQKITLILAVGLTAEERDRAESSAWERHPGQVIREMKTYRSGAEQSQSKAHLSAYTDRLTIQSRLYCPILDSGQCFGTLGLASAKPNAFSDDDVALVEFIASVVAVTYRKVSGETFVQDTLNRMTQLIDATHSGVLMEDEHRRVLHTNPEFRRIFGIPEVAAPHLVGSDCEEGLHQFKVLFQDETEFVRRVRELLANGEKVPGDRLLLKDGRTLERDYIPIHIHGRYGGILWNYRDITLDLARDQKIRDTQRLLEEERLRTLHAAKMASLGEMAGGVAHEINTPLAVISTLAGQLSEIAEETIQGADPEFLNPEFVLSHASSIESTSRRIAQIIRGMRTFARDGSNDPESWIDFNEVLADTLALCHESLKARGVRVEIDLPVGVKVRGRPVEISQILLNLISNSRDAVKSMPEKWIRVSAGPTRNSGATQYAIEVLVQDSGTRIPQDVQEKLFQPFFTTKPVGQGTGLGLGISKKLAESQGGDLRFDPTSTHTCFVLTLPAQEAPPQTLGT
jgi:signal transduction histidine kinase/putative methionine-R-sulfoxide reductase with GAF domain